MKKILLDNRKLLMSSDRSMRIVLLLLESRAEDQLAVAVQDKILAVLPSEEDASSVSDSLFKLKELRQSSIGKKCSRGHQAFIGLVSSLLAVLQFGLTLFFALER